MVKPSRVEKLLFSRPALYRAKRFLIEVVLWRVVLAGIFRLKPNAMPDMTATFAGRRVLLAACGPGDASTGPPISGAAGVTAFDISPQFAVSCARNQPDWKVYCGDLLHLPHRNRAFDVSVLYSALHHLPVNAAAVLSELARTTDGQIVLVESVVPKAGLLRAALLLWYRLVDGGYHYYTLEELEGIFQRLGLVVQSKGLYSPIRHMLLAVLDCRGPRLRSLPSVWRGGNPPAPDVVTAPPAQCGGARLFSLPRLLVDLAALPQPHRALSSGGAGARSAVLQALEQPDPHCPLFPPAQASFYKRSRIRSESSLRALQFLHQVARPYAIAVLRPLLWLAPLVCGFLLWQRRDATYGWLTAIIVAHLGLRGFLIGADERYQLPVDLLVIWWLALTIRQLTSTAIAEAHR